MLLVRSIATQHHGKNVLLDRKKVTTFVNHCVGELFNKIKSISDE